MTVDEYTDAYTLVCDVVERNYNDLPLEHGESDPWFHTSKEARAVALKIFEILGVTYE